MNNIGTASNVIGCLGFGGGKASSRVSRFGEAFLRWLAGARLLVLSVLAQTFESISLLGVMVMRELSAVRMPADPGSALSIQCA